MHDWTFGPVSINAQSIFHLVWLGAMPMGSVPHVKVTYDSASGRTILYSSLSIISFSWSLYSRVFISSRNTCPSLFHICVPAHFCNEHWQPFFLHTAHKFQSTFFLFGTFGCWRRIWNFLFVSVSMKLTLTVIAVFTSNYFFYRKCFKDILSCSVNLDLFLSDATKTASSLVVLSFALSASNTHYQRADRSASSSFGVFRDTITNTSTLLAPAIVPAMV